MATRRKRGSASSSIPDGDYVHLHEFRERVLSEIGLGLARFKPKAGKRTESEAGRIARAVRKRVQRAAAIDRLDAGGAGTEGERGQLVQDYIDAVVEYLAATRRPDSQVRDQEDDELTIPDMDVEGWIEMTARPLLDLARAPATDAAERRVADLWLSSLLESLIGDEAPSRSLRTQMVVVGARGGHGGLGKSKRPHSALIRRAVSLIRRSSVEVKPALVRQVLKRHWQPLAHELGDPLREIVSVNVPPGGGLEIEYTAEWAVKHLRKDTRFVELSAKALEQAIKRALEAAENG